MQVQNKIQLSLTQLKPGDILYRPLLGWEIFRHYGNYAGSDWLGRHFVFEHGKDKNVRVVPFEDFSQGKTVQCKPISHQDSPAALERMKRHLQEQKPYDPIINNCEHLSTDVATGKRESVQVFLSVLAIAGIFLAIAMRK